MPKSVKHTLPSPERAIYVSGVLQRKTIKPCGSSAGRPVQTGRPAVAVNVKMIDFSQRRSRFKIMTLKTAKEA